MLLINIVYLHYFSSIFQLVPMLQSLMYPNVVKVVAANDDTDEGNKVE